MQEAGTLAPMEVIPTPAVVVIVVVVVAEEEEAMEGVEEAVVAEA